MSGQDNSSTPNPTGSGPRIGRIGQWGATGGTPSGSNRSQSGARIATFRDLQSSGSGGRPARPDAEGDEEHSEGQTFFAGGERRYPVFFHLPFTFASAEMTSPQRAVHSKSKPERRRQ